MPRRLATCCLRFWLHAIAALPLTHLAQTRAAGSLQAPPPAAREPGGRPHPRCPAAAAAACLQVMLRSWRQDADGTYIVLYQSTNHRKARPAKGGFFRWGVAAGVSTGQGSIKQAGSQVFRPQQTAAAPELVEWLGRPLKRPLPPCPCRPAAAGRLPCVPTSRRQASPCRRCCRATQARRRACRLPPPPQQLLLLLPASQPVVHGDQAAGFLRA